MDIKFVGPASVSEQFIRSNLRLKAGGIYHADSTQDEIQALYATGQFYNIRVAVDQADDGGVILTYIVQARPRISDIKIEGNKKLTDIEAEEKNHRQGRRAAGRPKIVRRSARRWRSFTRNTAFRVRG